MRNVKATTNFFNFLSFLKKKSFNKSVNLQNFIVITLHKNVMVQ